MLSRSYDIAPAKITAATQRRSLLERHIGWIMIVLTLLFCHFLPK